MTIDIKIRFAQPDEQKALEALQWRASLANKHDREALLAHPVAIELPLAQIDALQVLVAEIAGNLLGFAAILPREDGDIELDGLFVEPKFWRLGIGYSLVEQTVQLGRQLGRGVCMSSAIRRRLNSTGLVGLGWLERAPRDLGRRS